MLASVYSSLGSLMAAAPSLEQLVNSNEAVKRGLYMANVYLMSSLDMMRNLQGILNFLFHFKIQKEKHLLL